MHHRFLVTCNKERADTSENARQSVATYLDENGFCGQDNRWGYGLADWYVIGGRWSGELSRHSWGRELYAWMGAEEQQRGVQVWCAFYGDSDKTRIQKTLKRRFTKRWRHDAPERYKDIPINRDTYCTLGYEDDAMLLTEELYDALLKQYEGEDDTDEHVDLDYDSVSPAMVGKKWAVVVDYHT